MKNEFNENISINIHRYFWNIFLNKIQNIIFNIVQDIVRYSIKINKDIYNHYKEMYIWNDLKSVDIKNFNKIKDNFIKELI